MNGSASLLWPQTGAWEMSIPQYCMSNANGTLGCFTGFNATDDAYKLVIADTLATSGEPMVSLVHGADAQLFMMPMVV